MRTKLFIATPLIIANAETFQFFDKKVDLEMWYIHTLNERVENRINEPYTSINFIKITSNGQNLHDMIYLV